MANRRRRQWGTGSVTQRPDGRWFGRIDAGFNAKGERVRKGVVRKTEAECKRALIDLARKIDRGMDVSQNSRVSVKAWAEQWLTLREDRVRPSSFNADRSAVTNWIVPTLGRKTLAGLTPADVRRVHKAMQSAGRADSSVTRAHATMMTMLKDAYLEGHEVSRRVLDSPPPGMGESERVDIPVEAAVKLIHAAADSPMRSRWVAALMQGMRQAECLGLTWDAVDLDAGTMEVSTQLKAIPYKHGCGGTCGRRFGGDCPDREFRVPRGYKMTQVHDRWHLVPPKTRAGVRVIPMTPWMHAALEEREVTAPDSILVWANDDGSVRDEKQDTAEWKALQDAAGVRKPGGEYYTLHECRHTAATILLVLGVDPLVVIRILGHSSILSTQRYQHVDMELMRKALEGVASTLRLDS